MLHGRYLQKLFICIISYILCSNISDNKQFYNGSMTSRIITRTVSMVFSSDQILQYLQFVIGQRWDLVVPWPCLKTIVLNFLLFMLYLVSHLLCHCLSYLQCYEILTNRYRKTVESKYSFELSRGCH